MPPQRLTLALTASLLLHLAVLGGSLLRTPAPPKPAPALQAALRLPSPPTPPPVVEPLVKNTLDEPAEAPREAPARAIPTTPKPMPAQRSAVTEKRQTQVAQRKLNALAYYPEEAILRGVEGNVHVILVLTEDGAIADVQIAASSGHAILDNAVVRAAWAIGRLPGATVRQMILEIKFQLR